MKKSDLAALGSGALFAIGLAISGMTRPEKILGFLDFAGPWDASLVFVMLGAIAVHFVAFRIITRRASPLFDTKFHIPTRKDVDARLILGATIFGVGWGLGGFCPGPAIACASSGSLVGVVFLVGMTAGIFLENKMKKRAVTS